MNYILKDQYDQLPDAEKAGYAVQPQYFDGKEWGDCQNMHDYTDAQGQGVDTRFVYVPVQPEIQQYVNKNIFDIYQNHQYTYSENGALLVDEDCVNELVEISRQQTIQEVTALIDSEISSEQHLLSMCENLSELHKLHTRVIQRLNILKNTLTT